MKFAFCVFGKTLFIAHDNGAYAYSVDKLDVDLFACIEKSLPEDTPTHILTTAGPASFTTLRIQIAAAQGLARGFGAELSLVKTFDLFPDEHDTYVIIDSRRGDFFTSHIQEGQSAHECMMTRAMLEGKSCIEETEDNLAVRLCAHTGGFEDGPYYMFDPVFTASVSS